VSLLRILRRYLRRYTLWVLLATLTIPMYGAASTAMVTLIEPIFDEVLLAGDETPAAFGLPGTKDDSPPGGVESTAASWTRKLNLKRLSEQAYGRLKAALGISPANVVWFVPILFVTVFFIRAFMNFVSGYAFQHIGLGIVTDLRNDLYRHVLDQSSEFHAAHPSGELVSRVIMDVNLIQIAVTNRLLDLFQQSVTLVLLVALLLSTDVKLALICLLVTPLLLFTIVRFGRAMRKASTRGQERIAAVTERLTEGLRGYRVVKAFGMEPFEDERFRHATRRFLRIGLWAQMLDNLSSPVIETLAAIGSAGLLVYAGLQIRSGDLTAPVLVQFIANLLLLYDPIRKLNKINLVLQNAMAGADRVMQILDIPNTVVDRPGAVAIPGVRQGLRFDGVEFSYGSAPVLRGVDLEIRRGEIVALVGPSGAGKSTLVSLVPRFFDPKAGAVRIDGRDIREFTLKSLREHIGIVTQDTVLFNETIRDNIAYGRSDLPLERVREAARAAFADDFILEQPDGYDTVIGEAGTHLSGGQRQRLTIARAILKDAPILILDEATSNLDAESESLVQKALLNLMKDRTTLVVAHRLATVMHAHRIVVMEDGRVVEQGTHSELLQRGGLYRRLYELQFESGREA